MKQTMPSPKSEFDHSATAILTRGPDDSWPIRVVWDGRGSIEAAIQAERARCAAEFERVEASRR